MAYSQSVKVISRFNDDQEEEALKQKVNNVFFEASSTGTAKTLNVVNSQLFVPTSGSRIEESGKLSIIGNIRELKQRRRRRLGKRRLKTELAFPLQISRMAGCIQSA